MKIAKLPKRYPASASDSLMHVARHLHDRQCRCVVALSGRLDAARLARAIRLSLDAEPVLGCRFVAHPRRPYWERVPGLKRLSTLSVVEAADKSPLDAFLGAPLDPSTGIQVQACLFRGHDSDQLVIKLSHLAADGKGMLDYMALVSRIYRELGANSAYTPPAGIADRGLAAVLRSCGVRQVLRGLLHVPIPRQALAFPKVRQVFETPAFGARRLEAEGFAGLREHCREHRVSLGQLLFAAYFRAVFAVFAPSSTVPLTIQGTLDLRRYLPTEGQRRICNLTGIFFPALKNQSLTEMAANIRRQMASDFRRRPWLGDALLLEVICRMSYGLLCRPTERIMRRQIASGRVFPFFANHGIIDEGCFDFRDASFRYLDFFGPAPFSPGCLLSVYTVGGTLTVTTCVRDTPGGRKARRLVDAFFEQLIAGAGRAGSILIQGGA